MTELEPLEIASGLVFGVEPRTSLPVGTTSPLAALENAVRPALARQPCLVSFSGGRDSSAILAVATSLARRERRPLPIPVTNRFRAAPEADESEWQERVVAHLGLEDWVRLEHDDELDCVGPMATDTLRRHGLLAPFNAHFHVPLLRQAREGSLLTGLGGDEMIAESTWLHTRAAVRDRRRVGRKDLLRAAYVGSPRPVRSAVLRRRLLDGANWLNRDASREANAKLARLAASEPRRWSAQVAWRHRLRYLHVASASLGVLADDADADIVHPFLEPRFVSAVAALDRSRRFTSRTDAMRQLFGELLPDEVLSRSTKACFDEAFWSGPARAFAAGWSGGGVDAALVDADALRGEWHSERPAAMSFLLAQSAWLGEHRAPTPQPLEGTSSPHRGTPSAAGV